MSFDIYDVVWQPTTDSLAYVPVVGDLRARYVFWWFELALTHMDEADAAARKALDSEPANEPISD